MPEVSKAGAAILWALKQVGKRYRMGAEVRLSPDTFGKLQAFAGQEAWDCSELVQAALHTAGVEFVTDSQNKQTQVRNFDGAWKQWEASRSIPVAEGIKTPGALLFVQDASSDKPHGIHHVAISLGNGYVLEARGVKYGVVISPVRKTFNLATKVDALY